MGGVAGCWVVDGAGRGGIGIGIVCAGPPPAGVTVIEGCPRGAGAPGTVLGGWIGSGAGVGAVCVVLARCWSNTDLAEVDPRVAKIAKVREVIMNSAAAIVVALERIVADPRGPKAVCDPIPPNAPARSAALPLCKSTTMTRKKHTKM